MSNYSSSPGGNNGSIQFNEEGAFGGRDGFYIVTENNPILSWSSKEGDTGDTTFLIGMEADQSAVITFQDRLTADFFGSLRSDAGGTYISSREGVLIETDLSGSNPGWNFYKDGSLQLPNLEADPTEPTEGAIWYRSDTNEWRGFNGTDKGTFTFVAD